MKVSVVIPAYNEEKMLGACLKSLQAQEVPADEIIVVDNNSTDRTAEIAAAHGARVVCETVQGMTPARNRGFDEAQGDIIARCDADTILPTDWIKKIKQNFEAGTIDALAGPVAYTDSVLVSPSPKFSGFIFTWTKLMTGGKQQMLGPNMLLTKKKWLHIRPTASTSDKVVHEDLDLSLKIIKSGGTIGYDRTLIAQSSARRLIKNPTSFFLEYPVRFVRTLYVNR